MKIENLPRLSKVGKNQICYVCKKTIKKNEFAVKYWWVKKSEMYSHTGCADKIKSKT